MTDNFRLSVFLVSLVLYIIIFFLFRNGRISIKYAFVWLIPATVILFVALIPNLLELITKFLGFQTISNMVIGVLIFILICICLSLTIIVSGQRTKITLLIQEVSILKEKIDE